MLFLLIARGSRRSNQPSTISFRPNSRSTQKTFFLFSKTTCFWADFTLRQWCSPKRKLKKSHQFVFALILSSKIVISKKKKKRKWSSVSPLVRYLPQNWSIRIRFSDLSCFWLLKIWYPYSRAIILVLILSQLCSNRFCLISVVATSALLLLYINCSNCFVYR